MVRLNWMSAASTIVSTAVPRGPSANPADGPYELLESAGPAEITLLRSGNLALAYRGLRDDDGGTAGPGALLARRGHGHLRAGAARAPLPRDRDALIDGTKTIGLALTDPSAARSSLGARRRRS